MHPLHTSEAHEGLQTGLEISVNISCLEASLCKFLTSLLKHGSYIWGQIVQNELEVFELSQVLVGMFGYLCLLLGVFSARLGLIKT